MNSHTEYAKLRKKTYFLETHIIITLFFNQLASVCVLSRGDVLKKLSLPMDVNRLDEVSLDPGQEQCVKISRGSHGIALSENK